MSIVLATALEVERCAEITPPLYLLSTYKKDPCCNDTGIRNDNCTANRDNTVLLPTYAALTFENSSNVLHTNATFPLAQGKANNPNQCRHNMRIYYAGTNCPTGHCAGKEDCHWCSLVSKFDTRQLVKAIRGQSEEGCFSRLQERKHTRTRRGRCCTHTRCFEGDQIKKIVRSRRDTPLAATMKKTRTTHSYLLVVYHTHTHTHLIEGKSEATSLIETSRLEATHTHQESLFYGTSYRS